MAGFGFLGSLARNRLGIGQQVARIRMVLPVCTFYHCHYFITITKLFFTSTHESPSTSTISFPIPWAGRLSEQLPAGFKPRHPHPNLTPFVCPRDTPQRGSGFPPYQEGRATTKGLGQGPSRLGGDH